MKTELFERLVRRLRKVVRQGIHGRAQRDADTMATAMGIPLEGRPGGAHDAFTHAYVSARLTVTVGAGLARRLGDLNELFGSLAEGRTLEAAMDQHNNAVGREIGARLDNDGKVTRKMIASSIKRALDHGELRVIDTSRDGLTASS